jgi:short-subunit dehydrogenase
MRSFLLITGAAGGLGSAFTAAAARKGFDLVLTDVSSAGQELAERTSALYGVEVRYFPCDLRREEQRTAFFEQLKQSGLAFWGLINVAGLDFEGAYPQISREQALRVLNVNLVANMDMTHEVLQLRDPSQKFRLINVCSMAGFYPMPFKATYAASKRFLLDFSLALREEIRDFGTVTALCPGGMPTTEACIRAIFAQGFWGWATTVDTYKTAEGTLKKALKGRAVYIPGWANKFLWAISALVPTSLKINFVAARWRKAQAEVAQNTPLRSEQHSPTTA